MEFKEELSSSSSSNQHNDHHPHSPPNLVVSSSSSATQKRKAGRKKFQETRHPVYKGVRSRNGKWVCELRQPYNKSRIWVGTFASPHMAARAYDVAALALRGDSASLNFPELAHLLPQARSASIRDIQSAVMKAADLSFNNDGVEIEHASPSSCSSSMVSEEVRKNRKIFLDEEELFNMPALLDSMAEGLILTPPALKRGFSWNDDDDIVDLTLWSG